MSLLAHTKFLRLYLFIVSLNFGLKMKLENSLLSKGVIKKSGSSLHPWVRRVGQALTLVNLSLAVSSNPVWAIPIVTNTDGTNTKVNVNGNQFNITGGKLSKDGHNLFHSFQDFNLDADQIATFVSNPSIQNILGRINGGNPSVINGLLQVSGGNSNLFLMNPSGIIFGQNATLNLPAAFTATTANGIQFGNSWFSATGTNNYKALTGAPVGFAFSGSQTGAIVNAGTLAVSSGQNLTLLGGTVTSTGSLNAPNGQVVVSSVPGTSYVKLSQPGQLLSLEVNPLSASATQPNASSVSVASLPQLLTGPGVTSATGLTVNADGSVQLTDSGIAVAPGDLTIKTLNAGSATLSAANTLSLEGSQIATAKDLSLSAQTVAVQDTQASPVSVNAQGNLSITGNQGIVITTANASNTPALQSGGDMTLASDGQIVANAYLLSNGNLSFENLTGGAGNLLNDHQSSLTSKGAINLGNYTGVSLKVEADGSIRGGDITITAPKTSGVNPNDPDYGTLTQSPALILRAGLSEPASIISIGNVTAHDGVVDLSTNGNIFTGNIDVSSIDSSKYSWGQQRITLSAHNIFTGDLKASSTIALGSVVPTPPEGWVCYLSDVYLNNNAVCGDHTITSPGGSISLDATQYLRTGNIDTSSQSANGGNVTIQANDAIVGSINTDGTTATYHGQYYGLKGLTDYTFSFNGGDVSVKTSLPFQSGAITTDGGQRKGKILIGTLNTQTSGSGQSGTGITTPDIGEIARPEIIRQRILLFVEAQKLAGQKENAQEISNQLNIPLEIAQIAVISPVGDNIKIPLPNLSGLYRGSLHAGDAAETGVFCEDLICRVVIGGVTVASNLLSDAANFIYNSILHATTDEGDVGGEARDGSQDQQLSKGEAKKLDKGGENPEKIKQEIVGKKNSGKYDLYKDKQGNIYVKPKGGQGPGEPTGLNIKNF